MDDRSKTVELLQRLRSGMFPERARAARQLAEAGNDPEVVPALCHTLQHDTHQDVRLAAVEALEAIGEPAALPALETATLDPSPTVRVRALAASQALHHPRAEEFASRIWKTVPLTSVLSQAQQGSEAAWAEIWRRLARCPELVAAGQDGDVRRVFHHAIPVTEQILQFLRERGDLRAVRHLCALLQHPDTPAKLEPVLLETLTTLARRHPTPELRETSRFLREHVVTATHPERYQAAAREIDAVLGASLPLPATDNVPDAATLPLPAHHSRDPLAETPPPPESDPRAKVLEKNWEEPSRARRSHLVLQQGLILVCVLALQHRELWPTVLAVLLYGRLAGSTHLHLEAQRLTLLRKWGALKWRRTISFARHSRFHVVRRRGFSYPCLAIIDEQGRPFHFNGAGPSAAMSREALEQLAEELNTYLEQQEGGIRICDPP